MLTIGKSFTFEAAHHLPQMPDGHQCKRPHGHSYVVEFELTSEYVNRETGFVVDFGALASIKQWIDDTLDHRDLAALLGGENTTAERLAVMLFHQFSEQYPQLTAVTVRETAKTFATYRP